MKPMESMGLRFDDRKLWVLDQQRLPDSEEWLECRDPEDMILMIRALKIRGAPLIGVGAALALAHYAERGASVAQVAAAGAALREARPTAVNLMNAIDRCLEKGPGDFAHLISAAETIFDEDVRLCDAIGRFGAELLNDGDAVLTHCNAGALATAGIGTAVGVITTAHRQGKRLHVYVDETRPLLQGARLTAWELSKAGVPYTLICDNMAASLMGRGKITKAIVGADRIAMNGDFANKIGTYSVAIAAKYHRLPLYVAAPYTTVDPHCARGSEIPIEEREGTEVRGVHGSFGTVRWSPAGATTANPAFDVTPAELVDSFILDCGVFKPAAVRTLFR